MRRLIPSRSFSIFAPSLVTGLILRILRANIDGLKDLLAYLALFGDKCFTRLRIHPYLHPILKAPMFGTDAIEEFLIFFQLEVLAITAYTQLNLFRHLSPLL